MEFKKEALDGNWVAHKCNASKDFYNSFKDIFD